MCDKPTHREFRWSKKDGFIKTKDGRFYKAEQTKIVKRVCTALFWVIILLYMAMSFLVAFIFHRLNLMMDFSLLYFASIYLIVRLSYSLTYFVPILEQNHNYMIAHTKIYPKPIRRRIGYTIFIAAIVFAFLNSYCVLLLRSTLGTGGEIVSASVEYSEYDMMNTGSIPLSEIPDYKYIQVTITKTPDIAEFNMNGQPIPTKDIYIVAPIQFIWEEDYFRSEYHMRLREVYNDSVLSMDCGDLHREWTFSADEG